ncbi:hypothetical protein [Sphingobacterium sp. 18053]|uniref:DUF6934 family protein n=1 Tax=Sphingobacterium sp. 18053 TaxID=2681401 RepID=UPI0013567785|nr:hypothetical protein [Sphingobacterium sp. 18053]
MNYPKYIFNSSSDSVDFTFKSVGGKGEIEKAIRYELVNEEHNIYNLCFGEIKGYNEGTGKLEIDDKVESKNGDMEMILATVASSAYLFNETYPERIIYFSGSTDSRTRLYRMAISKEYDEISKKFDIFGAVFEDNVLRTVPFNNNGYFNGFIIKSKQNEKS